MNLHVTPPPPFSVTKYFPLQLPTSVLRVVYNRLHSLIFCDHIVEKCHSRRPPAPQRHDDTMHENKFCERHYLLMASAILARWWVGELHTFIVMNLVMCV